MDEASRSAGSVSDIGITSFATAYAPLVAYFDRFAPAAERWQRRNRT